MCARLRALFPLTWLIKSSGVKLGHGEEEAGACGETFYGVMVAMLSNDGGAWKYAGQYTNDLIRVHSDGPGPDALCRLASHADLCICLLPRSLFADVATDRIDFPKL